MYHLSLPVFYSEGVTVVSYKGKVYFYRQAGKNETNKANVNNIRSFTVNLCQ